MQSLVIIVHLLAAIIITVLVLMQRGKGAEMGASFGSGASQTMFGSTGSGNVLTKSTTIFAIIFFVTSLTLAVFARQAADGTIVDSDLITDASILTEGPVQVRDADIPQIGTESDEDVPAVPFE